MASYLSYFTSTTSSQPPQQQNQYGSTQSSAASTWGSTFSSRIATLRKALTKDNEEDDSDNEDCSHVSNVLRAYYTEKGRPFPEWLPPDPKKPIVSAAPPVQYNQYGSGYRSNQYGTDPPHGRGNSGARGGLSDLWDAGPAQPSPQAQSLRASRPTPQSLRSHDSSSRQSPSDPYSSQSTARPLPSQRDGSYQNTSAAATMTTAPPVVGSRDRLRARLQGGGSGRNSPANAPSSNYQGSYNESDYGRNNSNTSPVPYTSASEPWSGNDSASSGYGNSAYRSKPGGPR